MFLSFYLIGTNSDCILNKSSVNFTIRYAKIYKEHKNVPTLTNIEIFQGPKEP